MSESSETKSHTPPERSCTAVDRQQVAIMIRGMNTHMAHVKTNVFGWLLARRIVPVRADILN